MAAPQTVKFPIVAVVRVVGVLVTLLLLTWAFHFRGELALVYDQKDLIFNVHPVLMVIGLILINGEGGSAGFMLFLHIFLGNQLLLYYCSCLYIFHKVITFYSVALLAIYIIFPLMNCILSFY